MTIWISVLSNDLKTSIITYLRRNLEHRLRNKNILITLPAFHVTYFLTQVCKCK